MVCQNCGCIIENGGHKSNYRNGWSASGYVCDNCIDEDRANAKAAFTIGKCVTKFFIGWFAGIMMALGAAFSMEKIAAVLGFNMNEFSRSSCLSLIFIVEGISIFVWLACKIFGKRLNFAILRFFCNIISFFVFWFALMWGVIAYLVTKYM